MSAQMKFVCLLMPNITQLDLTGPAQVFSLMPDATVDLAWHRIEPVPTDAKFSIMPTVTFDDAPQADVLMVPGGGGAFDVLGDAPLLEFIRRQAAAARFVTSVCTGAFVLGAAGLLKGRRATSHWASHEMLGWLGATPVRERVVRDGNIITGGGVTSGIDFGLTVAAEVYGDATAKMAQLLMEYDPRPPFDAGTPERPDTDPGLVADILANRRRTRGPAVIEAANRLGLNPAQLF